MASPPLVLNSDDMEVVLLPEVGARLHRVRAFGHDLLRTPDDAAAHAADPFFWGAYVMAPWCNRARPGATDVAGRTIDLAPNFPDGTAIHGQVYARPWHGGSDGWLHVRHHEQGWPWPYEVRLRPDLDGTTLGLTLQLTNRSDRPMPAGIGLHPWFVRPLEIRVPATAVYRSNADSPPRPEPVDGTPLDLRSITEPPTDLDATWTTLHERSVELRWPALRLAAELVTRTDAPACVAIATPRDPDATAVEVQTHGPDGFRRLVSGEPDALALLEPDVSMELRVELRVRRTHD